MERVDGGKVTIPDDAAGGIAGAASTLRAIDVTLQPAFTVTGRLVDPRGLPVEGVQVIFREAGHQRMRVDRKAGKQGSFVLDDTGVIQFHGRTGEEGTFVLRNRNPSEPVSLVFFHPFTPLEVLRPPPAGLAGETLDFGWLVLRPGGTVEGRVTDADGTPLAYELVSVQGRYWHPPARTDAAGRFVLAHVVPGTCKLVVLGTDRWLGRDERAVAAPESIEVVEGATVYVDAALGH